VDSGGLGRACVCTSRIAVRQSIKEMFDVHRKCSVRRIWTVRRQKIGSQRNRALTGSATDRMSVLAAVREEERSHGYRTKCSGGMYYLDMQPTCITKHNGGFEATNELLSLCRIEGARQVLNVGCGLASVLLTSPESMVAMSRRGHSEKMIEWSRRRAERSASRTRSSSGCRRGRIAFRSDRLTSSLRIRACIRGDKRRAIRECVRVTKPGGYVG